MASLDPGPVLGDDMHVLPYSRLAQVMYLVYCMLPYVTMLVWMYVGGYNVHCRTRLSTVVVSADVPLPLPLPCQDHTYI